MRKVVLLVVLALATAFMLSACGGQSTTPAPEQSPVQSAPETATPSAVSTESSSNNPSGGSGIRVFYTSDGLGEIDPCGWGTPAGGLARRASVVEDAKTSGDILLVDAGDAFGDNPADEDTRTKAELIADAMGRMGYDAFGLGEAELKYGPDFLKQMQEQFGVTYVSANLKLDGESPDFVKPYLIKEIDGKKVAVTSVIDSSILTDEKTSPAIGGNYSSDDYQTVLEKLVPELRSQADVVVVLAHIGPSQARELANVVPGIDVLIAGHDGVLLDPPVEVKDTLIGQASRKAKYIGEVSIELGNDNEVTGHSGSVRILNPDVKDDPDMLALVNDYKSKLKNPPTPTPSPAADN